MHPPWRQPSLPAPPDPRSASVPWRAQWRRLSPPDRSKGEYRSAQREGGPVSPLARDIVVVLVVKVLVLGLLWSAFFRAPVARQMAMETRQVERQIVAPRPDPEATHAVR